MPDKDTDTKKRISCLQASLIKPDWLSLHVMYIGWTISPTKRSDNARLIKIMLDGEMRDGFLTKATRISEFPTIASNERGMFIAALTTEEIESPAIFDRNQASFSVR